MKRIESILLALSLLLLSGCMWGRMRINDPTVAQRAAAIKPGVTRAADIAGIIGAQPTMRMPGKEHILFGYTYGDTKNNGLMLIVFNFMRSTTITETLYIEVDAETGIVSNVYLPKGNVEPEWRFWPFGD